MATVLIVIGAIVVIVLLLALFAPSLTAPFLDVVGDIIESMFD